MLFLIIMEDRIHCGSSFPSYWGLNRELAVDNAKYRGEKFFSILPDAGFSFFYLFNFLDLIIKI